MPPPHPPREIRLLSKGFCFSQALFLGFWAKKNHQLKGKICPCSTTLNHYQAPREGRPLPVLGRGGGRMCQLVVGKLVFTKGKRHHQKRWNAKDAVKRDICVNQTFVFFTVSFLFESPAFDVHLCIFVWFAKKLREWESFSVCFSSDPWTKRCKVCKLEATVGLVPFPVVANQGL